MVSVRLSDDGSAFQLTWWNRPGQSDSENGSRDSEKRAARQGRAGQGAGQGPSVRLSCRAGQGAGPCGKGRGQIKSKR